MSCFKLRYNPHPTKAWSRNENPCVFNIIQNHFDPDDMVNSPIDGSKIPFKLLAHEIQMLHKANILQHLNNSSRLTKSEKHSLQVRKKWNTCRTTIGTQSPNYTNPNTQSLRQVGGDQSVTSRRPPGICNLIPISDEYPLQSGGHLLANSTENPCTGQTIVRPSRNRCFPTTDSDVPGTPQLLCWNPRIRTWIPRQQLQMGNSGDKWPTNARLRAV